MKFITNFFKFKKVFTSNFLTRKDNMDILGKVVFLRSYAINKNETWAECVIRVIEGVFSIHKTHCMKNNFEYNNKYWNEMAEDMADTMFNMKWLPGGRHIKNMGTEDIINRGSLMLNNCSAVTTEESLTESALMVFRLLKDQAGVGFDTKWNKKICNPRHYFDIDDQIIDPEIIIGDILFSYENGLGIPRFNNIKNKRLQILNDRIINAVESYISNDFGNSRLILDVMNSIGVYVSGLYSRRSAQIAIGNPNDLEFISLKNITDKKINDERGDIMWASNNSVIFQVKEDFFNIPNIVDNIIVNGEPGIINGINLKKFGRVGTSHETITLSNGKIIEIDVSEDIELTNPCGEIGLEPYELCNLSSTIIDNCETDIEWYQAIEHATLFTTMVSLLMTEYPEINKIISKNRKIGVGITGLAYLFESTKMSDIIHMLKTGYNIVRTTNADFATTHGIPIAKKVTCVKPDGNTSLLAGTTPGIHYPPFAGQCIRRVSVRKSDPISRYLIENTKIPYEESIYDNTQNVFSFPYKYKHAVRSVDELSCWEQLMTNMIVQKFWADNNVSFTARFHKDEEKDLEHMISMSMPFIKSISFLKQDDGTLKEKYPQLPFEEISEEEYDEMIKKIGNINI